MHKCGIGAWHAKNKKKWDEGKMKTFLRTG
jgi:hypothetical protein